MTTDAPAATATGAPTTIMDLPNDMLFEIFEHVLLEQKRHGIDANAPPTGLHRTLRSVCRAWTAVADEAMLAGAGIRLDVLKMADDSAIRARHPGAVKWLQLLAMKEVNVQTADPRHSTALPRAVAALAADAELRRSLASLELQTCCMDAIGRAVPSVAAFTALCKLEVWVCAHRKRDAGRVATTLAPLSALVNLSSLKMEYMGDFVAYNLRKHGMYLHSWPALPNAPRLTRLKLLSGTNFVPVGSPVALGRLRRLDLKKMIVTRTEARDDPLFLRAAFDAGTWKPQQMTSLCEVSVEFNHLNITSPYQVQAAKSRPGAEWAPLAGRVTALTVIETPVPAPTPTGIVAGLGVLAPGLRSLHAWVPGYAFGVDTGPGHWTMDNLGFATTPTVIRGAPPVDLDRLPLGALTRLVLTNTLFPKDGAAFPCLTVFKAVTGIPDNPPARLQPFVGRPRLQTLWLEGAAAGLPIINLAHLFAGGAPLPALKMLAIKDALVSWDEEGLPEGTPTAAQFVARRREMLPSLEWLGIAVPQSAMKGPLTFSDMRQVEGFKTFLLQILPRLKEGVKMMEGTVLV